MQGHHKLETRGSMTPPYNRLPWKPERFGENPYWGFHPPGLLRIAFWGGSPWEKQACGVYRSPRTRAQSRIIRTAKYALVVCSYTYLSSYRMATWKNAKRA